jgi:peptide-methionine (S)-S-oxide reductase
MPTYHDLGDHTESVQLDYDPMRLSYQDLLNAYFGFHNPCAGSGSSTQYKAVIFVNGPEQERQARAALEAAAQRLGQEAQTEVLPAERFYLAEDYHQKYALRQYRELAGELLTIYPDLQDFIDSTAATRLNAFAHGFGTKQLLDSEIDSYGLSPAGQAQLRAMVDMLN